MKEYKNFTDRCNHEFLISPRGKIIKYQDVYKTLPSRDELIDDEELYGDDRNPYILCSIHSEICEAICKQKGYNQNGDSIYILSKLNYYFYGGISEYYNKPDRLTQSQRNTLFDLKK